MINIVGSILCVIFTIIPIFKFIQLKNNINKCWSKIKCTPVGQLLHPVFGPKEISSSQNTAICDSGKFSTMFDSKIKKYTNKLSSFEAMIDLIEEDVDSFKGTINGVKEDVKKQFKDVSKQFSSVFVKIGNMFAHIMNIVKRILEIFKFVLQMGTSAYYSVSSMFNGAVFDLARTFAGQ